MFSYSYYLDTIDTHTYTYVLAYDYYNNMRIRVKIMKNFS